MYRNRGRLAPSPAAWAYFARLREDLIMVSSRKREPSHIPIKDVVPISMEICKRNGIERFQIVSERGDGTSRHWREVVGSRRSAAIPGQGSELPSVFLQRGGLHRGGGRAGGVPSRAQEDSLPGFVTSGHASRDSRADRRKALVSQGFPFVVPGRQAFLPMLGFVASTVTGVRPGGLPS